LFQVQGGFAMLVDTSLSDLFRCVDDWMGDWFTQIEKMSH
jgi:hypothetical protein